jgi:hypothetical protein
MVIFLCYCILCTSLRYVTRSILRIDTDTKMESSLEFISLTAPATFATADLPTVLEGAVRTPLEQE